MNDLCYHKCYVDSRRNYPRYDSGNNRIHSRLKQGHLVLAQRFLGLSHNNFTFDVLLNFWDTTRFDYFSFDHAYCTLVEKLSRKRNGMFSVSYVSRHCQQSVWFRVWRYDLAIWSVSLDRCGCPDNLWRPYDSLRQRKRRAMIDADVKISKKQALAVGFAQAIALIPGVSRSELRF